MSDPAFSCPISPPVAVTTGRSALCLEILTALPQWFGRPAALDTYVHAAEDQSMLACFDRDGAVIGFVSLKSHGPATSEIYVLGVKPEWHRQGIGRALVSAAVSEAKTGGKRLLTVKTLSSSHPDPNYAATRCFYEAVGFIPVEELPALWGSNTPCLFMAMPLDTARPTSWSDDAAVIRGCETRLLQASTRASSKEVEILLADDFIEFGSSGQVFDKAITMAALAAEHRDAGPITREMQDFAVRLLGADAALITYKAVRHSPSEPGKTSLRSSIWTRTTTGWRMLFHQGTLAARSARE